jgi:hypothetical protein
MSANTIEHPDVAHCTRAYSPVVTHYYGRLANGHYFYFTYRFGRVTLAVGSSKVATDGRHDVVMTHGAARQGNFASDQVRDQVFSHLYKILQETSLN